MMPVSRNIPDDWHDRFCSGSEQVLSRLLSLAEREDSGLADVLERLHPLCDRAHVIGITGPPGAGKSTLADALTARLRGAGRTVGIVAVDPSSPFSGGAVLGDRLRMQRHYLDPGVFFRSLASRGRLGGLAPATNVAVKLLDAFGMNVILVETVGLGQAELEVMEAVDTVVVVLTPEGGDGVQAMKAGLMEIADVLVVNKSDRPGAAEMANHLSASLLLEPTNPGWVRPVLLTQAASEVGIEELASAINGHMTYLEEGGHLRERRRKRRSTEFLRLLTDRMVNQFRQDAGSDPLLGRLVLAVENGERGPQRAVEQVLSGRKVGAVGSRRVEESASDCTAGPAEGNGNLGALSGIRVLELASYVAGPHAGMILADLGAEVIKIEPPGGDLTRRAPSGSINGESVYFLSCNRNKSSLVLDLTVPEGRAVFLDLVRVSDVVVYNFRPAVAERLGLLYTQLETVNKRLVCCSISGFGLSGPYRERPGFDYLLQGYAGVADAIGDEGGPPRGTRLSVVDLLGGIHGAVGILAALQERHRTGRGQQVDIGLLDGAFSLLSYHAAAMANLGVALEKPPGSAHPNLTPAQIFPTQDSYMVIMAPADDFFSRLCGVLGVPGMAADPRFATPLARKENRDALVAALSERLRQRRTDEWLELMIQAGVPSGPVYTVAQALADSHLASRRMVIETEHPRCGRVRMVGNPVALSDSPVLCAPAPVLGQHTVEILRTLLGYEAGKVHELLDGRACFATSTQ